MALSFSPLVRVLYVMCEGLAVDVGRLEVVDYDSYICCVAS